MGESGLGARIAATAIKEQRKRMSDRIFAVDPFARLSIC